MKNTILVTCMAAIVTTAGAQTIPPAQGGPGTIDSATISTHQMARFSQGSVPGETHTSRVLGTDSAGNHIVGSVVRYAPQNQFQDPTPRIRSVVSKFDRSNNLVWARERTASGGAEQWGDGQPPISTGDSTGFLSVEVAGIVVDVEDNVIVAFNTFQPTFNNGQQGLERSQVTLLAKFNAAGTLVWRHAVPDSFANPGVPNYYHIASEVRSFALGHDGSALVLIDNYQVGGVGTQAHQSVVLKVASNGTRVFLNHYGVDANTNVEFMSTPVALSEDGSGNLFLVSTEYPWNNQTFAAFMNVIRKLGPGGGFLKEHDAALYPGLAADPNATSVEAWKAARADAAGNLFVGGTRYRPRPSLNDPDQGESKQLVLKFGSDLTPTWRVLGPQAKGRFSGQPLVAVMDLRLSSGGITVGGWWQNAATAASQEDDHWELSRYGFDDGHLIWHRLYQAPIADPNYGSGDRLAAFRVDAAGNVYASGNIAAPSGPGSEALIKYSDAGDLQFVKALPNSISVIDVLFLPLATNKPTFVGPVPSENKEVAVTEVDNPAVVAAPGSLANIATRVRIAGSDNPLIGGFIVTGDPGTTKRVLVRAIGPSLLAFGVTDALPDTTLELHDSAGHVSTNDNWRVADPGQPTQQSEIQATGIAPTSDLEGALIATVSLGNSTAIVRGKNGAAGIGLIEVYDLDSGSPARIANISTRGPVETGNNVMIGGVIVLQPNPARVLVRAIGPSLAAFGVPNTLQDPQLELRDINGALVVSNDEWKTRDGSGASQQSEIEETALTPNDPRESAVRVTLDPGNYTAIVRGKGGTTGVALVEVYRLP